MFTRSAVTGSRSRRSDLRKLFASAGIAGAGLAAGATLAQQRATDATSRDGQRNTPHFQQFPAKLRITKLETILVQPRWLFLKIHTDEGVVGLGEPLVEIG